MSSSTSRSRSLNGTYTFSYSVPDTFSSSVPAQSRAYGSSQAEVILWTAGATFSITLTVADVQILGFAAKHSHSESDRLSYHQPGRSQQRPGIEPSTVVGELSDAALRQAICNAGARPGCNTITFAPSLSGGTIRLTNTLEINDASGLVTISGADLPGGLTISGENQHRVFRDPSLGERAAGFADDYRRASAQ